MASVRLFYVRLADTHACFLSYVCASSSQNNCFIASPKLCLISLAVLKVTRELYFPQNKKKKTCRISIALEFLDTVLDPDFPHLAGSSEADLIA